MSDDMTPEEMRKQKMARFLFNNAGAIIATVVPVLSVTFAAGITWSKMEARDSIITQKEQAREAMQVQKDQLHSASLARIESSLTRLDNEVLMVRLKLATYEAQRDRDYANPRGR